VTVQDDIPSIVTDLDQILVRINTLPDPWSSDDRAAIAAVLERTREVLVALPNRSEPSNTIAQQSTAQEIAQMVISRIDSRLGNWFELLQMEVEQLRQQRQSLIGEMRQQKEQHQEAIAEGITALVESCSATVQQKLSQALGQLERQSLEPQLSGVEQFEKLQQRSDRLLMSLDSSLRTVFSTLEQDLQGYYDSLSQGLERMHSLGQQGEAKFLAYFQRLTHQIEKTQLSPIQSPEAELNALMSDFNEETIAEPSPPAEVFEEEFEEIDTITALTDLVAPQFLSQETKTYDGWYLGIDFGTEGLAAVLFHGRAQQIYPLAWISDDTSRFRLPAHVYFESDSETQKFSFVLGAAAKVKAKEKNGIFVENLKENLHLTTSGESSFQQAAEALFATLIPIGATGGELPVALGLSEDSFRQVLERLDGVILSSPTGWGEPYRDRLRQTVLKTQLVTEAERIFFVEEAIAVLIANLALHPLDPATTLVIHAGAMTTELALVDIPDDDRALAKSDITLESIAYGGRAIDQDILIQLLYPQWLSQLNPSIPKLDEEPPQPGEPDFYKRENLRLRLGSHPIGHSFLEAANLTKLILQEQEEFNTRLGNRAWGVKRQDYIQKIVAPYLEKIELGIDLLLARTGKSKTAIAQVICSGGTTLAVWHSLTKWLTEKLPNATLIQSTDEDTGNQVATGLACLPLFPFIFEQ
jgi:FtsZ-binding cell division protein ZapB